jgi:hypothetical protein
MNDLLKRNEGINNSGLAMHSARRALPISFVLKHSNNIITYKNKALKWLYCFC